MANTNAERYALVTGSARGIGAKIAEFFAKEGYGGIGINYNVDEESAKETVKLIESLGVPVKLYQADVSKKEDCERMITQFIADFGKIDVLVNNAGGALKIPAGEFDEMPLEYWDSQVALNLSATAYCCHYAIADMKKKGTKGRIINISSQLSLCGWVKRKFLPYTAAKSGMNALTMALANEVAKYGIVINAIQCGAIKTRIAARYSEEQLQDYIKHIPAGFYGETQDIANMAVFLADLEKPRYLIGQCILIDGGQFHDGVLDCDHPYMETVSDNGTR